MRFKTIKEKKNNSIMELNTFDYKNKFRNLEMDSYTFDETRNYIKNYSLPSDNTNEGKKMSIYKINPKINLDVSYNKNIFRQLYRNKINKNIFYSRDYKNNIKNLSKTEYLDPIQENTEYIINDYNYDYTKISESNKLKPVDNGDSNIYDIDRLTRNNELRINEYNNNHSENFNTKKNTNYELNKRDKLNEIELIKERPSNLLLSTYRNYGFGEE